MNDKQNPEKGATRRVMIARVDNEAGVLARIVGLISGRGWNIDSLTVHVEEGGETAKITIVFDAIDMLAEQVAKQIERQVPVRKLIDLSNDEKRVEINVVLVRLICAEADRTRAFTAANKQGGRLQTQIDDALIFSKTGPELDCREFVRVMGQFGTINTNGSGTVAIG